VAALVRRAGALLVVLLVVACAPMAIDEAEARTAAAAFIEGSAPLGSKIRDPEVTSVRQVTRGPVAGWAVEIHSTAVMQGETDGTIRAYWLFIDGSTGEVTIEGQG
jgi:hypothetical protein